MNRRDVQKYAAALALAACTAAAWSAEKATGPEAEALVKKAVALIKSAGPEKAYEEISSGKAFKDRDLYVFVYDFSGKCLAHGANPKLVGKDLIGMKDPDGKPLVKLLIDVAKDKGHGWTGEVKFRNPTTDKIQTRINYIERVGDTAVGSGIFMD